MNAYTYDLLILSTYHTAIAILGFLIALLGYSLFRNKIDEPAGDVTVAIANRRFAVRRGAPGTFFVVLGAAVIITAVVQGVHMSDKYSGTGTATSSGGNSSGGVVSMDGFGGNAGVKPLSYVLLESVRDYAECLRKYPPSTDAPDCEKKLNARINSFPNASDVDYIEKLELTPPDKRNSDWGKKMQSERNSIIGVH